MPPIQPNSEVPTVELNHDGTINLVVNLTGFAAGAPVEISGQVTQENGAVATFYSVQEMPPSGIVNLPNLPVVPNKRLRSRLSHHGRCAGIGSMDQHAASGGYGFRAGRK